MADGHGVDATPAGVRTKLRELVLLCDQRGGEFARLLTDAAEKEHAYKVAWAKAMFGATGSASKDREAEAIMATEQQRHDAKVAAALADACREHIRLLRDQLVAVESIGASLRAEGELAGRDWRAA